MKPNQLVRERPFIAHNIEFTRRAFDLDAGRGARVPGRGRRRRRWTSRTTGDTIDNIRLWDWRALQDTLRQIQEIRTYYDFPDIDIDRYRVGGRLRQMMVAARELNVEKLPESSRNWINEKLIYTHGYGVTMNTVNGFTPEGLPELVLSDMPVQSTLPDIKVTRPGDLLRRADEHRRLRAARGRRSSTTRRARATLTPPYEGKGGIPIGSLGRGGC